MPTLTPVDHDPFAGGASLTPVDHNPFAFGFSDIGEAQTVEPQADVPVGDVAKSFLGHYTPVGMLPQLAGGIAGGGQAIANMFGGTTPALDRMRDVTESVGGALAPTTSAGEAVGKPMDAAMEFLNDKASKVGGFLQDQTAKGNLLSLGIQPDQNALIGAGGDVLTQLAPLLALHKAGEAVKGGIDGIATGLRATSEGNAGIGGDISNLPPAQATEATLAKDTTDTAQAIAASQTPGVQNVATATGVPGAPVGPRVPDAPGAPTPEAAARTAATDAAPGVAAPLPPETPLDTSKNVPLAGGIAEKPDGPAVALDKRLPQTVTVPDRAGNPVTIDVHDAVSAHERTEHPIMKEDGKDYPAAHDIATKAENAYVEQKYNVDPAVYQKAVAEHVEPLRAGADDVHPHLDTQPYEGGDEHLLGSQADSAEKTAPNLPPESTGNSITDRFNQKLADYPAAKAEYAAHPETEGGRVINTDIARELSPDYVKDRTKSADVHEPASAFTKRMYADKLAEPSQGDGSVMFTAGGTGAGKSTGLTMAREAGANPDLIYDTNMNKMDSAVQKIDQALQSNRDVDIVYTHRDPVEAFRQGALKRAMRQEGDFGSGRTVPLKEHVKTHVGANQTIRQLAEKYKDDPRVKISVIDNSRGKGNAAVVPLDKLPTIDENGLHEKLAATRDEAHAAGEISDAVHQGFGGKIAEDQRPVGDGEVRPGAKPESAGTQPGQEQDRLAAAGSAGAEETKPAAAPSPQGPEAGDSVTRSSESPADGSQSIANKPTNADRLARGVEELVSEHGTTHADAFKKAVEAAKTDTFRGQRVADDIVNGGKRGVTRDDVADLLVDRVRISNEYDSAMKNFDEAKTDLDKAAAQLHLDLLSDQLELNEQASRKAGTEASWALSSRRLIAQKDYSLANQMKQAEIAAGKKGLSPEKAQAVKDHVARIADKQKKLDAALEKAKPPRGARKPVEVAKRERAQKTLDKLKDQITARLKACPLP